MSGKKSGNNEKPQDEARTEAYSSELGACACASYPVEDTEQTSMKAVNEELDGAPPLSLISRANDNEGLVRDPVHQPHSVIGCITGHRAQVVPLSDPADLDIPLSKGFLRNGRPSAPAPSTALNNQFSEAPQLGMNILPSWEEQRIDNRNQAVGIAEQQHSFRTTESFDSGPPAMSQHVLVNSLSIPQTRPLPAYPQSVHSGNATKNLPLNPLASFEGNASAENENIDVNARPQMPAAMTNMTAQNIAPNMTAQNIASSSASAGRVAGASQNSVSQGYSRIFIEETILVRKLPRKFITFLSERLDMNGCKNWKDLVELYGWNYEETQLFAHRRHGDGPFSSLLAEDNFQNYTLTDLKRDLWNIPRRDIFRDLCEMIQHHNTEHPL